MSGMSAWVTSDTTRWRRAVTGSVRKSMVVTSNPPPGPGVSSPGERPRAPSKSPYVAHSARQRLSSEKLESLTTNAIAHRDETDHRIGSSGSSAGEHSLIAIRLDVD